MARNFIIQQQREAIAAYMPVVDGFSGIIEVGGLTFSPEIIYIERDKLPFIFNINGPVSLRGASEAYSLFITRDQ